MNTTSADHQHNLDYVNFFDKNIKLENATFKLAEFADLSQLAVSACVRWWARCNVHRWTPNRGCTHRIGCMLCLTQMQCVCVKPCWTWRHFVLFWHMHNFFFAIDNDHDYAHNETTSILWLSGLDSGSLKSRDTIGDVVISVIPVRGGTTFMKVDAVCQRVWMCHQQRFRGFKKSSGFSHGEITTPLRPKDPSAWHIDLSEFWSAVYVDLCLDQDQKLRVHSRHMNVEIKP